MTEVYIEEDVNVVSNLRWIKDQMCESWFIRLEPFFNSEHYTKIVEALKERRKLRKEILPYYKNIFRAFNDFEYEDLRVVFLGQDPYYKPGVANGRAFCCDNTGQCQPSLTKIHEQIAKTVYPNEPHGHDPGLWYLGAQGVLLLNSSLTVEPYSPNIHYDIWWPFIKFIMAYLSVSNSGLIFVMMGSKAQKHIDNIVSSSHYIYRLEHPVRASYENREWDCKNIFNNINDILYANNNVRIVW